MRCFLLEIYPVVRGNIFDNAMTIYFYKVDAPFGCFSNFSLHPIWIDGVYWQTVEHYYQAHKFVGSKNESLIAKIRKVKTPAEAAQIGRASPHQWRSDWDLVKPYIMWEGVLTKFMSHTDIQAILLSTGEEILVEDSPVDYYWGCGEDRTGLNKLGQILMNVRQEIRWRRTEHTWQLKSSSVDEQLTELVL
jgi:hypothetical protein